MSDIENAVYRLSITYSYQKGTDLLAFKDAYKDLIYIFKQDCDAYIFQLELTGENNWHYQCCVKLKTKERCSSFAKRYRDLFPGLHVEIARDENALRNYCMKDESRQAGPWCDKPIYRGQDLPSSLFPWQDELKARCLGPVNDREIVWVLDTEGNKGKSMFCKYMAYHHKALTMGYATAGNLLNLVYKNQGKSIYLFDFTRSKPKELSDKDTYSAMESIKNGHFMNSKYDTGVCMMLPPHVIVFANQLPDFTALTQDRWVILEIRDKIIQQYSRLNRP